jgi:hypothetical protein
MENMRHLTLYITVFCMVLLAPAMTLAQTGKVMRLEDYKWENRLLLVFAPDDNNSNFVEQLDVIGKNAQGIKERDLVVWELAPTGKHAGQRKELLVKFDVEESVYTLILLGKDGLEKYRSNKPVSMEEIFKVIDQMPMRRQEMRKQE